MLSYPSGGPLVKAYPRPERKLFWVFSRGDDFVFVLMNQATTAARKLVAVGREGALSPLALRAVLVSSHFGDFLNSLEFCADPSSRLGGWFYPAWTLP